MRFEYLARAVATFGYSGTNAPSIHCLQSFVSMEHCFPPSVTFNRVAIFFSHKTNNLCRTFFSSDFFVIYYYKRLMQRFYDYSTE